MKYFKKFNIVLLSYILLCSCDMVPVNTQDTVSKNADTPSAKKTKTALKQNRDDDSLMIVLKKDTNVLDVKIKTDTIAIAIAGWSFYYPFGKFTDIKKLTTIGNDLELVKEIDRNSNKTTLYRIYNNAHSYVKFLKDDDTGRFELVSGEITDPDICLENGTKIGMSKESFCKTYFKYDIRNKLSKINVIEFITALDGHWNYYTFKNDKLSRIAFVSDYQVDQK